MLVHRWLGRSRLPFLLPMGWLPSLVGQPLVSPEAAFLWRGARLRQHPRRTAPADGQLRLPTAQASTDFAARLAVNRTTRTSSARGARHFCALRSSLKPSRRVFASLVTLPFHLLCFVPSPSPPAASAKTVKQWLLQRGVFVLHLGVEHESRSIAALTAAADAPGERTRA